MKLSSLAEAVLIAILFPLVAWSAEIERLTTSDGQIYRLSTRQLEADVLPGEGGRVIRLVDKATGQNLTRNVSAAEAPGGSGLLVDRIWAQSGIQSRHYEKSPYQVTASKADAIHAEITLKCNEMPLSIEKKISLTEGERRLKIDYELSNPGKNDFTGRFWSCHAFTLPPGETYRFFLPFGKPSNDLNNRDGIARKNYQEFNPKAPLPGNYFVHQPEYDYTAALGNRCGAAVIAPFSLLDCFYSFQPSATIQSAMLPTVEWFSLPFCLKPLAKGVADAVNHPELADPLQDYIYRFTMFVDPVDARNFDPEKFRPKATGPKSERFRPSLECSPIYREFTASSVAWYPEPAQKIKLLAVLNVCCSTEMIEFDRRIKTDLRMVEVEHPHVFKSTSFYGWIVPEPEILLEKELNANPRVILLSGTTESAVPKELIAKIRSKIEAGASLIYVSDVNRLPGLMPNHGGHPLPEWVTAGVPFDRLPVKVPVEVFPVGKGKVIWVHACLLNTPGLLWTQAGTMIPRIHAAPPDQNLPYWEYYFAFYGKLLRYAAGETPAPRLTAAVIGEQLAIQINATQAVKNAVLQVTIDGPEGRDLAKLDWHGNLQPGDNTVRIAYPAEKLHHNGDYYFNITLADAGGSRDWFAAVKTMQGINAIRRLSLDQYAHRAAVPVRGGLEITGSGELQLKLRDTTGRVLAWEIRPAATGEVKFELTPQSAPVLPLAELEATLKVNGLEVDQAMQTLTIEPLKSEKLNFVLWNHGKNGWIFADFDKVLSEIGFTVSTGGNPDIESPYVLRQETESAMRAGMRYAPMSMHRIGVSPGKLKSLQRDPCLRDPVYLEKIRSDVRRTVSKVQDSFPYAYYSGDENSLGYYDSAHDFCYSAYCLEAFRNTMQKKYGELDKLNRIWKTAFKTWEELKPFTFAEAQAQNNFIPWFEHRNFMMFNVSDAMRVMKSELVKTAPGARLGFSGQLSTDINGAFNWIEALKVVDNPIAYTRTTDGLPDLIRSYRQPAAAAGAWIGYGADADAIRYKFWNEIINGMFSPTYWWYGYLVRRGDGKLTPDGEKMKKLLAEIREAGADKIFAEAKAQPSPVALVYSIPSLVASGITGTHSNLNPSNYTNNFDGWDGLIRDLGFQPPQIINCEQSGTITPAKYPLLILPMTQVINDAAMTGLENYVKDGGKLIIDVQAGIYDGCGQLRTVNPLEKMAGVRITPAASGSNSGYLVMNGQTLRVMLSGGQVILDGGQPKAEIQTSSQPVAFGKMKVGESRNILGPAAIFNRCGKGMVVYLNFLPANYSMIQSQSASSLPVLQAFRTLLAELNMNPAANHQLPPGSSVVEYADGGNRYLGVTRFAGDADGQAILNFGGEYHVYDTMKHCCLGKMRRLCTVLNNNDVRTLALLPRPLEAISGEVKWNGRYFQIKLQSAPQAVTTVARVDVAVNGHPVRHYAANYNLREEQFITLDPGLEPVPGNWQFTVTDLFTGQAIQKSIAIKQEKFR